MCSKTQINDLIPSKWTPKGFKWASGTEISWAIKQLEERNLSFPLIVKPDIGLKGLGVSIVSNKEMLESLLMASQRDLIIQEKIPYKNEVGIFYVRLPKSTEGFCTGMARKDFLKVIGDGKKTVLELIKEHPRALLKLEALHKMNTVDFKAVPKLKEEVVLVPFGSHTRGAEFIDVSHEITNALKDQINEIAQQIEGFYFGRFDIMYASWEELRMGKNFVIVEINGAASEPIHMYDPKHSLGFAYKEIYRHWNYMERISRENRKGWSSPTNSRQTIDSLRENVFLEGTLKREMGL